MSHRFIVTINSRDALKFDWFTPHWKHCFYFGGWILYSFINNFTIHNSSFIDKSKACYWLNNICAASLDWAKIKWAWQHTVQTGATRPTSVRICFASHSQCDLLKKNKNNKSETLSRSSLWSQWGHFRTNTYLLLIVTKKNATKSYFYRLLHLSFLFKLPFEMYPVSLWKTLATTNTQCIPSNSWRWVAERSKQIWSD